MTGFDISFAGNWPESVCAQELAEAAVEAVCEVAPELSNPRLSLSLLFSCDAEIHALNREWRGRDGPTNVLSFPMLERDELLALDTVGPPVLLGDIALAHETCMQEAGEKNIPLAHHTAHLVVHGLLHLAGHDHVRSDEEAEAMEALEIAALAKMGIADPYGDRETSIAIT